MNKTSKWTAADPFGLTLQERRTIEYLRMGRRSREICALMKITLNTLNTYCCRAMKKTGTNHRLEMLAKVPPWSPTVQLEEETEGVVERGQW